MKNKERRVGTVSRGIRCPIIRENDDLASIVTQSVIEASEYEEFGIIRFSENLKFNSSLIRKSIVDAPIERVLPSVNSI